MEITDTAIDKVIDLLEEVYPIVYPGEKPTSEDPDEYIVVNALPIGTGVMQQCDVNANYHVKDIGEGVPDREKLKANKKTIISLLDKYHSEGDQFNILIDFKFEKTEKEDAHDEHYANVRFIVRIINK